MVPRAQLASDLWWQPLPFLSHQSLEAWTLYPMATSYPKPWSCHKWCGPKIDSILLFDSVCGTMHHRTHFSSQQALLPQLFSVATEICNSFLGTRPYAILPPTLKCDKFLSQFMHTAKTNVLSRARILQFLFPWLGGSSRLACAHAAAPWNRHLACTWHKTIELFNCFSWRNLCNMQVCAHTGQQYQRYQGADWPQDHRKAGPWDQGNANHHSGHWCCTWKVESAVETFKVHCFKKNQALNIQRHCSITTTTVMSLGLDLMVHYNGSDKHMSMVQTSICRWFRQAYVDGSDKHMSTKTRRPSPNPFVLFTHVPGKMGITPWIIYSTYVHVHNICLTVHAFVFVYVFVCVHVLCVCVICMCAYVCLYMVVCV